MCGICGVKFNYFHSINEIKEKFFKVLNNIHHRGPIRKNIIMVKIFI